MGRILQVRARHVVDRLGRERPVSCKRLRRLIDPVELTKARRQEAIAARAFDDLQELPLEHRGFGETALLEPPLAAESHEVWRRGSHRSQPERGLEMLKAN